ncbi:hypothetical protein C0995_005857 [Termitomyces sp. Mi166|nr:hypothetical protein C0995_005857 [Termitomyces sp. Mi166\
MTVYDSIRSPPPEYVDREDQPFLRSSDAYGAAYRGPSKCVLFFDYYLGVPTRISTVGPVISAGRREDEHAEQPTGGISIKVLLYWGLLCAIFGAVIQRWASVDPRDPNVRQRILEKWKEDVDHQQQLRDRHKQEAGEWKSRAKNFEKEWQARLDEKTQERERAALVWGEFVGDPQCASSGRRKYYARLWNLTPSLSGIESCMSTPATINGITYDAPVTCEDKGILGVYGHWMAENETICSTFWEFVKRKVGEVVYMQLYVISDLANVRIALLKDLRYEAKLGDFHPGEDAEKFCLSTPITINGQLFQRPTACSNRYQGFSPWAEPEYWGIWDIPDDGC